MASSGMVKVACVAGAEKGGKRGEIIREGGGSERKGEEGSHADLPALFYNYVECAPLTNTNFEYFNDTNLLCPIRAFDWALDCYVINSDQSRFLRCLAKVKYG